MHTTQACTQLMLYVFSSRLNSKNNPITMNNKMSKPRDLKKNNPKAENSTEGKTKKKQKEKETQTTHQFLCPPSLKSGSIAFFLSSPIFVSLDEVKKNARSIAANLERPINKIGRKVTSLGSPSRNRNR